MSIWVRSEEPSPYRLLYMFLTPKQREQLQELAATENDWRQGRESSKHAAWAEYYKLDITEYSTYKETLPWLWLLIKNALGEIEAPDDAPYDAYLLFYPPFGGVPWHKDPAPAGKKHVRLNAIVVDCEDGGNFRLMNPNPMGDYAVTETVPMTVGSAVIFSPSEVTHSVSAINKGQRLVLSVGVLVDE